MNNKTWTVKDVKMLKDMNEKNSSISAMSKKLNKTEKAIYSKLYRSGLKNTVRASIPKNKMYKELLEIAKVVSEYYEIEIELFLSGRSFRIIVEPRQISQYLARKFTKYSLNIVGDQLGRKDHATVLHSCKTVKNQIETNKNFKEDIDKIEKILKERLKSLNKKKIQNTKVLSDKEIHEARKNMISNISDVHSRILFNNLFSNLVYERERSKGNL